MPIRFTGENSVDLTITIFLLAILIFLLIIFAVYLVGWYKKRSIVNKFNPGREGVDRLLRMEFGKKYVISDVYLPTYENDELNSYIFADTIVLLKNAIVICRIKTETGMIYNSESHDWHQSARLRSGGMEETDFKNPVYQNQDAITALRKLYELNELDEPQMLGFVIFPAKTVKFQYDLPNVQNLENSYEQLKGLKKRMKGLDDYREDFRSLIRHYAADRRSAERFNRKHLGL